VIDHSADCSVHCVDKPSMKL